MFLKLDKIAGKLDQIFLPLEQEGMTGMRLLLQNDVKATAQALKNAQEALGVNFPAKFLELISKFDLGNFEICNVSFGSRGDYVSELVRLNSVDEFGGKWWIGEAHPLNLIVFAVGDPWIFLLDCTSGAVYAWLFGDEELCGRCVASDFEKFFIALASTYIARLNGETLLPAEQILKFVKADEKARPFWQEMAQN
ncbi:SMI1/KNR4 family protein [Campylobacter concisus]|uniref:SMI1/KNR4 family protein n=1 Tax=Campylobacter concisus TaxID=199 RepID=UPI0018AB8E42|nr:SMI1/KNR4 family protein [Campylobacter concisus]QPH98714.1 SMI1/KNR4 family protein [Campylobacter concisus]QPI00507.1 SMI1/KNR4 family protein [Campylobacter concisus]